MTESDTMEVETKDAKSPAEAKKDEGNELYKVRNYKEALQHYSEAISLAPECAAYYGNRSACHMMLGQYSQALDDARLSVTLDPAFVKGYVRIVKCCLTLGDVVQANQALAKAAEVDAGNALLAAERQKVAALQKLTEDAKKAHDSGDHRKSLYCVDQALGYAPASRQLKLQRAECLAKLGRLNEGSQLSTDLLRMDQRCADAIFVRGLCLYFDDEVDKAFTHFKQVLQLAPDHIKARDCFKRAKNLKAKKEEGNNLFKSSNWKGAIEAYSEALLIDPLNKKTNAKLYCNRAIAGAKLKNFKESVSDCTAALKLDEDYVKALGRRARSYMELEEYEEAVRDAEKAFKLDKTVDGKRLLQEAKLELKKSKRKNYYKILGITKGASDDEIKKAYRKRALVHHPDRHANATEEERKEHEKKFKDVGEAYGVLSDAKKRQRYDNGADLEDLDGGGHGGFGGDVDPTQIFQAFFGGGMPGGGGGSAQHFSFGGAGGGGQQMPPGFSFQFQ